MDDNPAVLGRGERLKPGITANRTENYCEHYQCGLGKPFIQGDGTAGFFVWLFGHGCNIT